MSFVIYVVQAVTVFSIIGQSLALKLLVLMKIRLDENPLLMFLGLIAPSLIAELLALSLCCVVVQSPGCRNFNPLSPFLQPKLNLLQLVDVVKTFVSYVSFWNIMVSRNCTLQFFLRITLPVSRCLQILRMRLVLNLGIAQPPLQIQA